MTLEEQSRLSYYRKISDISGHKNVELVQHVENARIYVKKTQTVYDRHVYEILRELKDPFFPKIEECVEDGEKLILVEDYISGETLQAVLDRGKTFSLEQTAEFMTQICRGLGLLHSQDPPIVHRDIKPSNLILTSQGDLRLIDCNAARQFEEKKTADTVLIGTQGFAAPEQYGFRQTDPRTDIYSLGILAHILLTGHMPQAGLYKGFGAEIIQKCIELDPANRYANLNQLCAAWQEAVKQKEMVRKKEEAREAVIKKAGKKPCNLNRPLGFRTGKKWKMMLALVVYYGMFCLAQGVGSEESGGAKNLIFWANFWGFLMTELGWVLLWGNFRGVQSHLPLMNRNRWLNCGMLVLYSFLWLFLMAMACVVVLGK